MKKVIYSITKLGRVENIKITGVGYITDEELIIAQVSKRTGKAYIKTFDCIKNCHPVVNTTGEFKGAHYEIHECQFETKTSSGESTGYETREIEVTYYIWYKLVD